MRFDLLGPMRVIDEGGAARSVAAARQRILLAALLTRANQPVPLDSLGDLVWDGAPPAGAAATLRAYVMRLRRALGPVAGARLRTSPPGYLIQVSTAELDISFFEQLCERAGQSVREESWEPAGAIATRALALWRGTPLTDVPSQLLRDRWVPHLEQLRAQAREWQIEAELNLGRPELVVPLLRELVARNPLAERLHALLVDALARAGRQAEALTAYQQARRVLISELGIEPGAELQELQRRILAGSPPARSAKTEAPQAKPATPRPGPAAPRPGPAGPVPRQLPATVPHFAGRVLELKTLSELLDRTPQGGGTVVITAIDGTAGIGKTALAVHWAQQNAHRFPDGQLYLNLHGFDRTGEPVQVGAAVRRFLTALGVAPAGIPADVEAQVDLYRSRIADLRLLVVLDNAHDADQVRPLLPGSSRCAVVVTSRRRLTGLVAVDGAYPLTLDLLSDNEARELLVGRLGAEYVAGNAAAADELITRCAHLPLALNIAAARAATHPDRPLPELVAALDDVRARLDVLSAQDSAADLRAVFSWSVRSLRPAAARLFRLLGVYPGPDIGAAAVAALAGVSRAETGRLLGELTGAHLVAEQRPGRYLLHDLLRAYAAELAQEARDESQAALRRVLEHCLHTAAAADRFLDTTRDPVELVPVSPGVTPEPLSTTESALRWFEREHAVLLAAAPAALAAGLPAHAWQLGWACADFLQRQGHWHDQVDIQQVVLAAARELGDDTGQAYARRVLGRAHTRLSRFADAHGQFRSALDIYQRAGDRAGQAAVHRGIAWALDRESRTDEAIRHATRALEFCRENQDQVGAAYALNTLGWLHVKAGQTEQALTRCAESLALHRAVGNTDGEANTFETLGYTHQHRGAYAEAIAAYQQALAIFRVSAERFLEADALCHLGDAHAAAGDTTAARRTWQEALAIFEDMGHPDAAQVRARLES
ncbi:MAG TPA: BTAD domain-containing putative transcriptional regulator [Pseudonocardiaceae bacterium]|nr:BTAD domain-containing putative transcriptional regulator [Pseudonocardiaceae bacterium]